jgi:hypothetical protein
VRKNSVNKLASLTVSKIVTLYTFLERIRIIARKLNVVCDNILLLLSRSSMEIPRLGCQNVTGNSQILTSFDMT